MEATMRLADSVIAELELEAASTRRVLERIPEDKLSWRPHPKSMSLGQLALHIASTPAGVAKIASMDTMEAPDFDAAEGRAHQQGGGARDFRAVARRGQGVPAEPGR